MIDLKKIKRVALISVALLLCISALPSFAATEAELKQELKQLIEKSRGRF